MPVRTTEWFNLLQSNPLVGLALPNVFDLIEYALVGLIFLATYAALRQANHSAMAMATIRCAERSKLSVGKEL
jgi:hypothetical protein